MNTDQPLTCDNQFRDALIATVLPAATKLALRQKVTASDLVGAQRYGELSEFERDRLEFCLLLAIDDGDIPSLTYGPLDSRGNRMYMRIADRG